MRADLTRQYLYSGGEPILSMAEFQSYAYGLPEGEETPETLFRWSMGEAIAPRELAQCLHREGTAAASSSDESLEIVRRALDRLRAAFPRI